MPSVAVGDLILVTARHSLFGQRLLNTFPYEVTAYAGTAPTQLDLFTALHTALNTGTGVFVKLRACMTVDVTMEEAWYQDIRPVRYRKYVFGVNTAGSYDGNNIRSNTSASVTRASAFAGRKEIGGIRVVTPDNAAAIADGKIVQDYKTALQALADKMKETQSLLGGNCTLKPCVGVPAVGSAPARLEFAFPQTTARVMRRRTVGLGE